MMGIVIGMVARAGVPRSAQRLAAWLVLLILAALMVWIALVMVRGWIAGREVEAVQNDRAAATIETLDGAIAADRGARSVRDERDRDFTDNQELAREAIRNADDDPAGDASALDALHAELRRQDGAAPHPGHRP